MCYILDLKILNYSQINSLFLIFNLNPISSGINMASLIFFKILQN